MQTDSTLEPSKFNQRANSQCAFTIDVEDWYQSSVDFNAPISGRVVENVKRCLDVLDECGVKATFFIQGLVAKQFPKLVEHLHVAGHEIQSHGHTHRPLFGMSRHMLEIELELARKSVEDAGGIGVTAFRAPDFSIVKENLWALEVLAEAGFTVDSSIFPMRMRRYGIADQPMDPHRIQLANGASILEAPVAVVPVGKMRVPVAGGGYFRLLPCMILEKAFREILQASRPVIVYCHPYEFNPIELKSYRGTVSRHFLFTQSLGRVSFVERIRLLMKAFAFGRLDEALANWNRP